eukprot:1079966-Amphidinium_carterae.2
MFARSKANEERIACTPIVNGSRWQCLKSTMLGIVVLFPFFNDFEQLFQPRRTRRFRAGPGPPSKKLSRQMTPLFVFLWVAGGAAEEAEC